jgi:hypothetical protein
MNLKNYTSEVAPDKSIAAIEKCLIEAGAVGIAKEYKDGRTTGLVFKISFEKHKPPVVVKLPANVEGVHQTMWSEYCSRRNRRHNKTDAHFRAQAERTAWRIMQDWVEVQVSLIKLRQIDALQAFLPYCFDGERTIYQKVVQGGFAALNAPAPEPDPPVDESPNGRTVDV